MRKSRNQQENQRCNPRCRHYFRMDGGARCNFGNGSRETERGADCMGRFEIISKKTKETQFRRWTDEIDKKKKKKSWREPPDRYCRAECEYFHDGICNYGPQPHYAEVGCECLGKKRMPRKKFKDFQEVKPDSK